jgi:hypothetical protein
LLSYFVSLEFASRFSILGTIMRQYAEECLDNTYAGAPLPAAAVDDDVRFAEIVDQADLHSSLAISIQEAAYRRDASTIALHIAEMRMTGLALVRAYRALKWGAA